MFWDNNVRFPTNRYTYTMDIVDYVKNRPVKRFSKGEIILSEGEITDTLLAIRSGYCKISSIDDAGDEHMLWIAGRYDIIPTERLFSARSPLQFFYTALSDIEVYEINKADFITKAKADVSLMTEIAASMSGHYDDLLSRVNSTGHNSVRERLIGTLRYVAERFSAQESVDLYQLGLRLTHKDIAEMIGSTRETTSLELKRLHEEGCITYDRKQFIIHLDRCKL
jgi:CRP/FNR family transcriptional regulator